MERYIKIMVTVTLILGATLGFAGGGGGPVDNSKTVNLCQGMIDNCAVGDVNVRSATIGAAGDKLSFDTTNIKVTNFGRITKMVTKSIAVAPEGEKIFTFTPTQGSMPEKQIKVLFYAFDIHNMPKGLSNENVYKEAKAGISEFPWANTMLKVYRQLAGEMQWTELAASFSDAQPSTLRPIKVDIYPDARAVIYPVPYLDEKGNLVKPGPMTADLTKQF